MLNLCWVNYSEREWTMTGSVYPCGYGRGRVQRALRFPEPRGPFTERNSVVYSHHIVHSYRSTFTGWITLDERLQHCEICYSLISRTKSSNGRYRQAIRELMRDWKRNKNNAQSWTHAKRLLCQEDTYNRPEQKSNLLMICLLLFLSSAPKDLYFSTSDEHMRREDHATLLFLISMEPL